MEKTVVLAALTSALTLVATEAIKGVASNASKDLWTKIKSTFGWSADPPLDQVPLEIASRLDIDPQLAAKLLELLQSSLPSNETAAMVVSHITANRMIIATNVNVGGELRM
jgi:hypothetical protein